MRPFTIDVDPANIVADGLGAANDSSGATYTMHGTLTSGGTFTSADGLGRIIAITDAGTDDQSGATYTLTGTDADGYVQTEAITGPTADATVESTKYFLTITSITIASPAATSTADIGTVDEVATSTVPLDMYAETALNVIAELTGTANWDIQVTNNDPFNDLTTVGWVVEPNWDGKSANTTAAFAAPGYRAMRVIFNTYTDTAELQVYCTQPASSC
jgi:hypothetical protein